MAQKNVSAESAIHVQNQRIEARLQRLVGDVQSYPGAMPLGWGIKSRLWR